MAILGGYPVVLVIDDDAHDRRRINEALREECEVVEVESVAQALALEYLGRSVVDVVVVALDGHGTNAFDDVSERWQGPVIAVSERDRRSVEADILGRKYRPAFAYTSKADLRRCPAIIAEGVHAAFKGERSAGRLRAVEVESLRRTTLQLEAILARPWG